MELALSARERDVQDRARRLCEEHLLPVEVVLDEQDGLTAEQLAPLKAAVIEARLNAVNMPRAWGGQELTTVEQVLCQEQLGRATGSLWDVAWRPANVLARCTPEQRRTYLEPEIRGERRHAYAVSEPGAGSDPSALATRARRVGDGYLLSGEKWFVTSGDIADFLLVVARVDGDGPTIFLVDKALDGVRETRRPRFMHAFPFSHSEFVLDDVRVGGDRVLGEVGQGLELTKEWFSEERLMIAARCLGGAERCLDTALAYAGEREQFGAPIGRFQGVAFPLADCAVELAAARALTYQVAFEADRRALSAKALHARAAAAKLFASEMAGRVADRCVQILGGRGYMRENPCERLYRDLRVDRIWEGTSEIQRSIVANELLKRGRDGVCGWPV